MKRYQAIVIGVSFGGLSALKTLFSRLPEGFRLPFIVVQHISPRSENDWIRILDEMCKLQVKEADEKEKIEPETIYIAPPNYHLLVERDHTLSLSVSERVNFARPSVDVLFDSAADAFGDRLIGIILTGSNSDGAMGIERIRKAGGLIIVQDPASAEAPGMPEAAIAAAQPDYIVRLDEMVELLIELEQLEEKI